MNYLMVIGLEALVILYLTGVVIHLQDRLNETDGEINGRG